MIGHFLCRKDMSLYTEEKRCGSWISIDLSENKCLGILEGFMFVIIQKEPIHLKIKPRNDSEFECNLLYHSVM